MNTRQDCAFAAGLFEGEGTVYISPPKLRTQGQLMLSLSSTDKKLIDFLVDRWPGNVVHVSPNDKREYWRWGSVSRDALVFLLDIRPFMVSNRNKQRVVLGIEFQQQKSARGGVPVGQVYKDKQKDFQMKLKEITHSR